MRVLVLMLLTALLASPLWAVKLKLKSEDKEVETTVSSLSGDVVSFKRARKDFTARIDDFEPASAFLIKKQFTPDEPRQQLELARFALHRGLYATARDTARAAAKQDTALAHDADAVSGLCDILEADGLLDTAGAQIEAGKVADARATLTAIRTKFAATPAATRAEVLLSTLDAVELELRAKQLEDEARKSQEVVDADERKKRQPVDDWLAGIQDQVKAVEDKKIEADADCNAGKVLVGLPKYESAANSAIKVRKLIEENRKFLKYRGQPELADRLDQRLRTSLINIYERWGLRLYQMGRYDVARDVANKGIALDPRDRRLLQLRVDIDEMYDPSNPG